MNTKTSSVQATATEKTPHLALIDEDFEFQLKRYSGIIVSLDRIANRLSSFSGKPDSMSKEESTYSYVNSLNDKVVLLTKLNSFAEDLVNHMNGIV